MAGPLGKFYSMVFSSLALIISLFYFTRFAPLDPEVHHDGVMLAAAIAVSEGKIPNRDVFAQYGPLAPILQGIWVHFTDPTLISIRVFTAVILAATTMLIFIILSRFLSRFISGLITATWATSYPFFILPVNLPWSSVITTFLSLVILYLVIRVIQLKEAGITFYLFTFLASFLACVSIFGRIHMILTLFCVGLFSICLKERNLKLLYIRIWAVSSVITLTGIATAMSLSGALSPYINQSLLWASNRYVGNEFTISKAQIMEKLLLLFFPLISSAFYFANKAVRARKFANAKKSLVVVLVLSVAPVSILEVSHKSYLNPKYFLVSVSQNFTNWLGYSAATFLLCWFINALLRKSLTGLRLAFGLYGITVLSQLYPLHDVLHLYWITPVLIVVIAIWVTSDQIAPSNLNLQTLKLILVPLLAVNIILSTAHLSMDRVDYKNESALQGMRGKISTVTPVEQTMNAVISASATGTIEFDCMDGLYAVSGGTYLPTGPNFVNWGPQENSKEKSRYILSCNLSLRETRQIAKKYEVLETVYIDAEQTNLLYQRN
jgi:hypothetical protein